MRTVRPVEHRKTYALIGGFTGLMLYVLFGLMPSIVYGGFAGTALAHGIAGHEASFVGNLVVLFGMFVGGLSVSAVFVIVGAVCGAGVFAIGYRRERGRLLNGDSPKAPPAEDEGGES